MFPTAAAQAVATFVSAGETSSSDARHRQTREVSMCRLGNGQWAMRTHTTHACTCAGNHSHTHAPLSLSCFECTALSSHFLSPSCITAPPAGGSADEQWQQLDSAVDILAMAPDDEVLAEMLTLQVSEMLMTMMVTL